MDSLALPPSQTVALTTTLFLPWQDLRGALDEISISLQVRFEFHPSQMLEVQGRRMILHLDRDSVPESAVPRGVSREELLARTYGVTTASAKHGRDEDIRGGVACVDHVLRPFHDVSHFVPMVPL